MRGADTFTENLFTMRELEDFVPADHPLRSIRTMANEVLAKMGSLFSAMYEADTKGGRPSVAPEKLLRVMLLQVLYSVRSERHLMEQVQYNFGCAPWDKSVRKARREGNRRREGSEKGKSMNSIFKFPHDENSASARWAGWAGLRIRSLFQQPAT